MISLKQTDLSLEDLIILSFLDKSTLELEEFIQLDDEKEEKIRQKLEMMENEGTIIRTSEEKEDLYKSSQLIRFRLSERGKKRKKLLWSKIGNEDIDLIDEKDVVRLKLKNIIKIIKEKSLIEILKKLDDERVLNLDKKERHGYGFVGREEYLERFNKKINRILEGNGSTVVLKGRTGIGKTRLAEELKNIATEKGFDFFEGKCYVEDYSPYGPVESALEKFLEIEKDVVNLESIITPHRLKENSFTTSEMFDAQRKSIFYDTTNFLKNLSRYRPLVLFFDDLQWADKGTLNLLDYMTDRLKEESILIICAYRPGDINADHPLTSTLRKMSRKKVYEEFELEPLDESEIKDMIAEITGLNDIPEELITDIRKKTNGVPLFIKESLKQMIKENIIDIEKGKFPSEAELAEIPDVVQNVVEKRVFDLDDETREILQICSVVGKRIPFELITEISDEDELEILEKMDDLLEKNILEEHPRDESFIFSHDFFVDTIYQELGDWLEKKNLHQDVGKAIEKVYEKRLDEMYSTLGHHFSKAECYKKAFEYFRKAGKKAEDVYAHEDAIERYKRALFISNKTQEISSKDKISLLENLGDANNLIANYDESRKYLHQAFSKASALEDRRRIYRKIAESWFNQGEFDEVIGITDEAIQLDEFQGDSIEEVKGEKGELTGKKDITPEICNLLSKKGWALKRKGEYIKAKDIFFKELEIAKDLGQASLLAQAYNDLGSFERGPIKIDACIHYLKRSIEIRSYLLEEESSFKERYELFRPYNNLGVTYISIGKLNKGLSYFKKALELNDKIKDRSFELIALNNLAQAYKEKGEIEKSEDYITQAMKIIEGIDDKQNRMIADETKGQICMDKGELDEAIYYFSRSIQVSSELDYMFKSIEGHKNLSITYTLKGDLKKARKYAEKGLELADKIDCDKTKEMTLLALGRVERLEGEIDEAIEHHKEAIGVTEGTRERLIRSENRCELIEDYIAKNDFEKAHEEIAKARSENLNMPDINNKLEMLEGIVYRKKEKLEKAKELLIRCLEDSKEMSKRYRIARIKYELGLVYDALGNDDKSYTYLDEAKRSSNDIGLESLEKECKEILENLRKN